jgi:hypothetical protein
MNYFVGVGASEVSVARKWVEEMGFAAIAPLALLVILITLPPTGGFPVADDWDYAATVGDLLKHKEIRLSDWPMMTLIAHVAWGAVFSLMLGFSYRSLWISTLVSTAIGAVSLYATMRLAGKSRSLSVFAAHSFVFCPLTLCFSYSFMTDVPASAWMLVLTAIHVLCSRSNDWKTWCLLGLLASAAYLVRQTAVAPTLVFLILSFRRTPYRNLLAAAAPLAASAAFHRFWLGAIHGLPYNATHSALQLPASHADAASRAAQVLLGVGLYLTPVASCWLSRESRKALWTRWYAMGAAAIVVSGLLYFGGESAKPYCNDAVFDFGLGADSTIPGRNLLVGPAFQMGGRRYSLFWTAATTLALISTCLVVAIVFAPVNRGADQTTKFNPSVAKVAGLGMMLLLGLYFFAVSYYERYLIPVVALAPLALLAGRNDFAPRRQGTLAWIALASFGALGVAGVQDYQTRNKAVWEAIASLRLKGVDVDAINGGFEFAGAFRYNPHYRDQQERVSPYLAVVPSDVRESHIAEFSPIYHYLEERRYTLSYVPFGDNQVERRIPFRSWLRSGEVLVLRRIEPPQK